MRPLVWCPARAGPFPTFKLLVLANRGRVVLSRGRAGGRGATGIFPGPAGYARAAAGVAGYDPVLLSAMADYTSTRTLKPDSPYYTIYNIISFVLKMVIAGTILTWAS
jgi:hypothetical protein